jgi:cell division septum initiation protein DivIVA
MEDNNSNHIPTRFFGLNRHDVNQYLQKITKEEEGFLDEPMKIKKQLERTREKLLADLEKAKRKTTVYEDEIISKSTQSTKSGASDETIAEANKRFEKTTALINILADEEVKQMTNKANEELAEYDKILDKIQETIFENRRKIDSSLSDVLKLLKSNINYEMNSNSYKEKIQTENHVLPDLKEIEILREKAKENTFSFQDNTKAELTADSKSVDFINNLLALRMKYAPGKTDTDTNEITVTEDSSFEENLENVEPYAEVNKNEDDIIKMRNSFIIGKVAGDDLLDNNAKVVIGKGKTLTEEDIVLAEKESKLPELIVNMVLPN